MTERNLAAAQDKMRAAGVSEPAIEAFGHYYGQLEQGVSGLIREADIEPLVDPPRLADVTVDPVEGAAALDRTVLIRLNGGLGTSMGMDRAKSLLPVRGELRFLDVIVEQVRAARELVERLGLAVATPDEARVRAKAAAACVKPVRA